MKLLTNDNTAPQWTKTKGGFFVKRYEAIAAVFGPFKGRTSQRFERFLDVALAIAIGAGLALALVQWWTT